MKRIIKINNKKYTVEEILYKTKTGEIVDKFYFVKFKKGYWWKYITNNKYNYIAYYDPDVYNKAIELFNKIKKGK